MQKNFFEKMLKRWVTPVKSDRRDKCQEPPLPSPKLTPEPAVAMEEPRIQREEDPRIQREEEPRIQQEEEDAEFFERRMRQLDVTKKGERESLPRCPKKPAASASLESDHALFMSYLDEVKPPAPEPEESREPLRKLKVNKREKLVPAEVLDLHGKTIEEALHGLASFVAVNYARGNAQVMVITGKGRHSRKGSGVLKPAVEQWILNKGGHYILSYAEASPSLGGSGAMMLNLRKV